jgi:glycerol-3-phosphate acyltransferase PlsY
MFIFDLLYITIGYIVGAIPIGFLYARMLGIRDIRTHGSGNIGATNVARVLGKQYFFLIFLLDAAKAFVYLWLLKTYTHISEYTLYITAFAVLLGNVASIFLKGRGGKGVSTSVGIMMALQPLVVPWVLAVWLIILSLTKTVGIASVVATMFLPLIAYYMCSNYVLVLFSFFASMIILWRHKENIKSYYFK